VAVAFLAIYMVALRPKSSTSTPTAAAPTPAGNVNTGKPAVTQFGKAVQAAQGAKNATEKQMQGEAKSAGAPADSATSTSSKSGSSTATRSATPKAAAAPASTVDVKGLPRPVAKAVRRHKVLALLFWNGRSVDDHMVRSSFRHVLRFHGAVYTHVAPLKSIAHYARITQGVNVQQSPTVVVVDRNLKATTLVGYVDTETVDQAIVDALRASGGIFTDPYLRRVNNMCSSVVHDLYDMPQPTSVPQARHDLKAYSARWDHFYTAFQGTPAPKKWRSFKHATVSDLQAVRASNHRIVRDFQGDTKPAVLLGHLSNELTTLTQPAKRFTRRMDRAGLVFCGSMN
jgi:hypothetical protein